MSKILELLCTEYKNVYGFEMKKKFSTPKTPLLLALLSLLIALLFVALFLLLDLLSLLVAVLSLLVDCISISMLLLHVL